MSAERPAVRASQADRQRRDRRCRRPAGRAAPVASRSASRPCRSRHTDDGSLSVDELVEVEERETELAQSPRALPDEIDRPAPLDGVRRPRERQPERTIDLLSNIAARLLFEP